MRSARRVFLISPKFHSYWESISKALEQIGYDVVTHLYDDFSTPARKIRNKVAYEFADRVHEGWGSDRLSREETGRARAALRESDAELVLVVKADVLDQTLWAEINDRKLPIVLWLYDELQRTKYEIADLYGFDAVASYSANDAAALDAAGITAAHVPLAFDATVTSASRPTGDVVFVGARYPNRERLLRLVHEAGIPVRAYGRDWSHHPLDRIRTWKWQRPDVPAEREVSRADAYALMAGSAATLNIHGDQDGFTMRTFEVPGMKALQLIDRADVEDLYEPGAEVVVFESEEELIALCQRSVTDRVWRRAIGEAGYKRTIADHTFDRRMKQLVQLWG